MKLKAVLDILQSKLHRRGIDLKALTVGDPESAAGGTLRQRLAPARPRATAPRSSIAAGPVDGS